MSSALPPGARLPTARLLGPDPEPPGIRFEALARGRGPEHLPGTGRPVIEALPRFQAPARERAVAVAA